MFPWQLLAVVQTHVCVSLTQVPLAPEGSLSWYRKRVSVCPTVNSQIPAGGEGGGGEGEMGGEGGGRGGAGGEGGLGGGLGGDAHGTRRTKKRCGLFRSSVGVLLHAWTDRVTLSYWYPTHVGLREHASSMTAMREASAPCDAYDVYGRYSVTWAAGHAYSERPTPPVPRS